MFQFRFPAGEVKSEQFATDSKLSDVMKYVSEHCPIQLQNIAFVQVIITCLSLIFLLIYYVGFQITN